MKEIKTDKIGVFMSEVLKEVKEYTNIDDMMLISSALSMMSVVLGNKVHTYVGNMDPLYSNVLMLIIAPSGTGGKTSTVKMLNKIILKKILEKNQKDLKIDSLEYKQLSKEEKSQTQPPRLQQIVSGQGSTFQGIIKSLEKNPHGQLAIYDEAGELLSKLSKDITSKYGFTSLYDQDYYGKDLAGMDGTGDSLYINNPYLSLLAVTNPYWFKDEVKDSDYVSGFLNRFSIIKIHKTSKIEAFKQTKKHDFDKLQNTSLSIWKTLNENYSNENPLILNVENTYETYKLWHSKMQDKYPVDEENEFNDAIQSSLIRQLTAALKYAMIIQIFDEVFLGNDLTTTSDLQEKYIKIGMYLAERYIEHFQAHLDNMTNINVSYSETKKTRAIDILADKIERYMVKNYDDFSDFQRSVLTKYVRGLNAKNFDEAMEHTIQKYRYIKVIEYKIGKTMHKKYKLEYDDHIQTLDEAIIDKMDVADCVNRELNPNDPSNILIKKDMTDEEYVALLEAI